MVKLVVKSNVLKNMLTLLWGILAARFLGLAAMPLITRMYTPESLGAMSVFIAVTFVMAPVFTMRYPVALPTCYSLGVTRNIVVLSFLTSTFIFLTLLSVLFFFDKFDAITKYVGDKKYIYYCLFGAYFLSLNETVSMWGTRLKKFKLMSLAEGSQAFIGVLWKIVGGLLGAGSNALIIGQSIQQTLGSLLLMRVFYNDFHSNRGKITKRRLFKLAYLYIDYPKYRLPSHFLMAFSMQSPVIFVSIIYGGEAAGYVGLAMMAIAMPVTIIGKALGSAYYAEIGTLSKDGEKASRVTTEVVKKLLLASIIPAVMIFVGGEYIFILVFGEEWKAAGKIASLMSFYMIGQLVANPIMNVFNVFGGQKIYLIINGIRALLVTTVFLLFSKNYGVYFTMAVYSALMGVFYILVVLFAFKLIKLKG